MREFVLVTGPVFSSYIETVLFTLNYLQVEEAGVMRWGVNTFSLRKG